MDKRQDSIASLEPARQAAALDLMGYMLGEAMQAADPDEVLTEMSLDPELPSTFVVQQFANGDFCGKAGQRRSIEVRYTCFHGDDDDQQVSSIISIEEERTCHYIVVVHLTDLCHLKQFRKVQLPQYEITCNDAADKIISPP